MQIFPPLIFDICDGNLEQCLSFAESVATALHTFPPIGVELAIFFTNEDATPLITQDELFEESQNRFIGLDCSISINKYTFALWNILVVSRRYILRIS